MSLASKERWEIIVLLSSPFITMSRLTRNFKVDKPKGLNKKTEFIKIKIKIKIKQKDSVYVKL